MLSSATPSASTSSNEHTGVELSVIVPTFNESARLPRTLAEILPWLRTHITSFEVIVVDDNSPDGTADLVRAAQPQNPELRVIVQANLGKGAAVRRGCLEARGRLVMFIDADHSTPIDSLAQFLPQVRHGEAMAVAGVRTYQEDEDRWRRIIGLVAQLVAHVIVFKKAVVDSQCGFKLFTRKAVARLMPYARVNGGMLDVELFYLMHKFGVPCRFVPVLWDNKPGSRINVWLCMVRDPLDMLRIRLRDLRGVYARPLSPDEQPWNTPVS